MVREQESKQGTPNFCINISDGERVEYEIVKGSDGRIKAANDTCGGGYVIEKGYVVTNFCFRYCKDGHNARDFTEKVKEGYGGSCFYHV